MTISLIAPGHRTELWQNFYNSIITNLPFEVIFVTDREPKSQDLLKNKYFLDEESNYFYYENGNFKWIYSPVKPAQCFEIAYREAKGDLIVWTGDDFVYSPYALDNVYNMYKSFHDPKAMISFTIVEDGEIKTTQHVIPWDPSIQLTTSALISREAIETAGGLADVNFVAGKWDVDLMMRIYAQGGKVYVCPGAFAYEPHCQFHKLEHNLADYHTEELNYFTELWQCKDGNGLTLKNRTKPFEGYKEENLLIISQGNKGKWK